MEYDYVFTSEPFEYSTLPRCVILADETKYQDADKTTTKELIIPPQYPAPFQHSVHDISEYDSGLFAPDSCSIINSAQPIWLRSCDDFEEAQCSDSTNLFPTEHFTGYYQIN